ncbi:MAG: amidohydrolase family protein [Nocardioidaceae bacterium]
MRVVDDHTHPFPRQFEPLDLATLTLDVHDGPEADRRRHGVAGGRLALEHLRVRLGNLLGCAPADVEAARDTAAAADWPAYVRSLMADACVDGMLLDGGAELLGEGDLTELGRIAGVDAWPLLRVEAVVDPMLTEGASPAEIVDAVERLVSEGAARGAGGAKTVLAYRTGLDVDPDVSWPAAEASVAGGEPVRRRAKALRDHVMRRVLAVCADLSFPLQVHTGFGDSDIRLSDANPLLLEEVLRTPEGSAAPVVLIHGSFPWHEQAAYLAATRPMVWTELSLHNLFSPATTADRLLRVLDLAPAERVLLGSDGHGAPETHWFALRVLHDAWAQTRAQLDGVVRPGWLDRTGERIFAGNARALYHLDQ